MTLLAAVRRSACRMVSGSGLPPSLNVVRATKSVDSAHADARRALDALRGTPAMDGAESDLFTAQYFYGLASSSLGRASEPKATRDGISSSLRGATSDLMDGSTAVLRAAASLQGEPSSSCLREGALAYVEGATNLLRASETAGDHAAWFLDFAAGRIGAAATSYTTAVEKINAKYISPIAPGDLDLFTKISLQFETAKEGKEKIKVLLENFPFEVKEKHDSSDLILTRTYHDELIEVMVSSPFLATKKPSNLEAEAAIALQVTITKGSTLTMFTCSAFANELRVNKMYMRLTIGKEDKEQHEICFEGSDSDGTLQELVYKYLDLRGVCMMTASFLIRLLSHRGVFVNILWLDIFKSFVKQSR